MNAFLSIKFLSLILSCLPSEIDHLPLKFSQHRSAYDLILYVLAQFCKERAVASYSDYQILVLLRMLLSFKKRIVVHVVELHLSVSKSTGCTQQRDYAVLSLPAYPEVLPSA